MDDKHNYSRDYLLSQVAILLGGRIAEEITRGDITTGAGNDLERATELSRRMVCEWGMSEALGPLTFGKKEEQIFLGREIAQHQDYSEDTAIRIDQEVRRIVLDNYKKAKDLLEGARPILDKIADELLVREVLDADQVKALVEGKSLGEAPRPTSATPPAVEDRRGTKERTPMVPPMPKVLPQE
jgi:cell division protease FtsH